MHAQMKAIHPDFDPDSLIQTRNLAHENGLGVESTVMTREADSKVCS